MAETEQFIGANLDLIGKLDMLKIEDLERSRIERASPKEREGVEEFIAIIKESVGASIECKNLIRKMHSGLQMLNATRAVFVGTSQSRLQQVEEATENIKSLRLRRGQTLLGSIVISERILPYELLQADSAVVLPQDRGCCTE